MTNSNTQFSTTFPEYAEWMGSPQWREHLLKHDFVDVPGCAGCAVGPLLKVVHEAVMLKGKFIAETWALQDGYGAPGVTPPQGWDWSGIRDSSPAAIDRMHSVVSGVELVEVNV